MPLRQHEKLIKKSIATAYSGHYQVGARVDGANEQTHRESRFQKRETYVLKSGKVL